MSSPYDLNDVPARRRAAMNELRERQRIAELEAENKRVRDGWTAVDEANKKLNAMLADRDATIKALREVTGELADDVEAYVLNEYPPETRKMYPHISNKFERGMEGVIRARALLESKADE